MGDYLAPWGTRLPAFGRTDLSYALDTYIIPAFAINHCTSWSTLLLRLQWFFFLNGVPCTFARASPHGHGCSSQHPEVPGAHAPEPAWAAIHLPPPYECTNCIATAFSAIACIQDSVGASDNGLPKWPNNKAVAPCFVLKKTNLPLDSLDQGVCLLLFLGTPGTTSNCTPCGNDFWP